MADIFVSYTSSDRGWAFWIGQQLERLGHTPHLHDWEISAGGDIAEWMEARHDKADNVLLVVSEAYLTKGYSKWERLAAQWAARERPNFALPVLIEDCKLPTLLAHIKRCELYGINKEEHAREWLDNYLRPATKPIKPVAFPPRAKGAEASLPPAKGAQASPAAVAPFPGGKRALSNITMGVPRHFLGRGDELAAIDAALKRMNGGVAALYGLRGVGKSTLAAAYAESHRKHYHAIWWIRAQTPETLRADLVSLGVRLRWVARNEEEEPALEKVRERLRYDGEGLLLICDNAIGPASVEPYCRAGGAARTLITSNSPAWRGVAEPVEIRVWPKTVGAEYLVARTGRDERADAEALSETLGGLTLAHEQAAAYCERLGLSLAEYRKRFAAAPEPLLDAAKDASPDYHGGLTVAKAFSLAIDEAAKLHPAADPLITYAALLAPEPIPLFLFSKSRQTFGGTLASLLAGDGLDEAVAALRSFALVDRERILDERDPTIATDTIRLHRLVRTVASGRLQGALVENARRVLIKSMAKVYPTGVLNSPSCWPQARRLDALALDLVAGAVSPPKGVEDAVAHLVALLEQYHSARTIPSVNFERTRPSLPANPNRSPLMLSARRLLRRVFLGLR